MKTIGVVFGGVSSEYGVSLQSAQAVLEHLDKTKFKVIPIGITQDGRWYLYMGEYENLSADTWWKDPAYLKQAVIVPDRSTHGLWIKEDNHYDKQYLDAIMPILHGKNGEDGTIQGLIELANIPLIGCKTLASALCMDKARAHQLAKENGIKTAYSLTFKSEEDALQFDAQTAFKLPIYIKPVKAGSSYGISRITDYAKLKEAIHEAFLYDDEIMLEEEIVGFEVGCALMDNQKELIVGEVDEIEVVQGFFDFKEKYILETAKIHLPARLEKKEKERIQQTAKKLYRILNCHGFARVDMFYTPDKEIVFNEINTIPGFTAHSRYPKMMEAIGISFETLLSHLIEEELYEKA